MQNRDPILLNRFRDESLRIRDRELARQFKLSLGLVLVLLLATASTLVTMSPNPSATTTVVERSVSRNS